MLAQGVSGTNGDYQGEQLKKGGVDEIYIHLSKSIDDAKDLGKALSGGMRVPSITSSSNVPWFMYWASRHKEEELRRRY
jgi:hypothetical protein